jgi:hypothetical protein
VSAPARSEFEKGYHNAFGQTDCRKLFGAGWAEVEPGVRALEVSGAELEDLLRQLLFYSLSPQLSIHFDLRARAPPPDPWTRGTVASWWT